MAKATAYPVRSLREYTAALEAGITVCLAEPRRGRVHEVRKTCRKIEALIALIDRLPGLPHHRTQSEMVLKRLRHLRRAAGRVRDLDVQRGLLKQEVLESRRVGGDDGKVLKAARKLRRFAKQRRKVAANKLLHTLKKRQGSMAGALEDLLTALRKAEPVAVTPSRLLQQVRLLLKQCSPQHLSSEKALHDVRKRAKQARYQTELFADAPSSVKSAQDHAEQLQGTGGEWHDWLQLADLARRRLGADHAATHTFCEERDRKLESYRQLLGSGRSTGFDVG